MQALPDSLCYLNGEYLRLCDAKVSVLDRGFIFGDGVYEVAPVYGGRFFRFQEHMARLARSLAKVRIPNPHTEAEWLERMRGVVGDYAERFDAPDQLLYLQVTRGVALRDHVMPTDLSPTVFITTGKLKPATPEQRHQGERVARDHVGAGHRGRGAPGLLGELADELAETPVDHAVGDQGRGDLATQAMLLDLGPEAPAQRARKVLDQIAQQVGLVRQVRGQELVV